MPLNGVLFALECLEDFCSPGHGSSFPSAPPKVSPAVQEYIPEEDSAPAPPRVAVEKWTVTPDAYKTLYPINTSIFIMNLTASTMCSITHSDTRMWMQAMSSGFTWASARVLSEEATVADLIFRCKHVDATKLSTQFDQAVTLIQLVILVDK